MHFIMLQRLESIMHMSQSVVVYTVVLINVSVFCWFGSVLSEQESTVTSTGLVLELTYIVGFTLRRTQHDSPAELSEMHVL